MLNELFEYEELNEIMIAVIILEIEEAVIIFLENNPIIKPIGAIINQVKIDENSIFGEGTEKAVNALLKKWGYKQTSIAGEKFIKKLASAIK